MLLKIISWRLWKISKGRHKLRKKYYGKTVITLSKSCRLVTFSLGVLPKPSLRSQQTSSFLVWLGKCPSLEQQALLLVKLQGILKTKQPHSPDKLPCSPQMVFRLCLPADSHLSMLWDGLIHLCSILSVLKLEFPWETPHMLGYLGHSGLVEPLTLVVGRSPLGGEGLRM